jgi:plastocyanin
MLAAAALLVAGCGSSSSSSTTASTPSATPTSTTTTAAGATGAQGASTVSLSADPSGQLSYNTTSLSAKAGAVTISFTNASPLMHNVTLANSSGTVVGSTPTFSGGTKSLTANLKPGTYTFYCSVPGHRAAGMQGTLTVK